MSKILLYTDEAQVKKFQRQATEHQFTLNTFIRMSEKETEISFTDTEKVELKEDGAKFLKERIEPMYPFPAGAQSLNAEAIGINIVPLIQHYQQHSDKWKQFDFDLRDGRFELSEKQHGLERFSYYVETEKQKEAYEMAVKLSTLLNDAMAKKFVDPMSLGRLNQSSNILTVKITPDGKDQILAPSGFFIAKFIK